jgi:hypothetical protein
MVSVTPRPRLTPGKGPPVPIVQEAGWAPEPVWTQGLEEKSFGPAGDRTPYSDSILTELSRLLLCSALSPISVGACQTSHLSAVDGRVQSTV